MKVALVASYVPSLSDFRGPLIREMVSRGWRVTAYGPDDEPEGVERVRDLGAEFQGYPLQRAGLGPLSDWKSFRSLKAHFLQTRPDLVLSYTAKPMVYGSLAGHAAGARTFSLVTGLGYAFTGNSLRQRVLRLVQVMLYRWAFSVNETVIFQNPDDRKDFVARGLVSGEKTGWVSGSGIDLEALPEVPARHWEERPLKFVMVARLLREKGVLEYLEAASVLKEKGAQVQFQLIGGEDPNPGGLPRSLIEQGVERGAVDWVGQVPDVSPYLLGSHIFVLPSYREGTPRSTLEALALGMPVVTTDAVGCRETVVDGRNGLTVPVADPEALTEALQRMSDAGSSQLAEMGAASRRLAEERFDVRKVNRELLGYLEEP